MATTTEPSFGGIAPVDPVSMAASWRPSVERSARIVRP
jgi:hypothetical protein